MNCQPIRQNIENSQQGFLKPGHLSSEMLAHINGCADCKNFIEQRRELALSLQRIRQAAPAVPQILDHAVLTAFRQRVEARHENVQLYKRARRLAILSYSAAMLATAVILVFLLLPSKKTEPRIEIAHGPQALVANQVPGSAGKIAPQLQIKKVNAHKGLPKQISRRNAISVDHSLLPSGFTSLMYCDPLSCAGDMEIVRVQVFPSMLGVPAHQSDATGTVLADVLVGPDGIARGIRFEQ